MSATVTGVVLAVGTSFLWSLLAKVTLLLAGGLMVRRCLPRTRASVRHMVLASAVLGTLAVPCAAWLVGPVTIGITSPGPARIDAVVVQDGSSRLEKAASGPATSSPAADRGPAGAVSAMGVLTGVWLAGTAAGLVLLAGSMWHARRIRRGGVPAVGVLTAGWDVGLTGDGQRMPVLLHEAARVPVTCGVLRPFVLLPLDAREWTDGDIRRALLHEFEHVRRRDVLVSLLGRVACAVYWFHPLVWMAARRMQLEAERACDDAVLLGADRAEYAEQLVTLAARISGHPGLPGVSMAGRTPSDLTVRVSAILAEHEPRGRVGHRTGRALAAGATALVLVVSPVRAARAGDSPAAATATPRALVTGPVGDRPSFDVASIRITIPEVTRARDGRVSGGFLPGGRYQVQNYPLRSLIAAAFLRPQINPDFLIAGGPPWIDSVRFDIEARAAGEFPAGADGPTAPRRIMLQNLLAERFGLRTHVEPRDAAIFTLVRARPDRLGSGLRTAQACDASDVERSPKAASPTMPCAVRVGPGSVVMRRVSIGQLVNLLPRFVNRVVIDNTGLDGPFDLDLTWTPAPGEWVAPPLAGVSAPPVDGPSLVTALAEQLGLRLVSGRGPADYLVIDDVHMPKEN